MADALNIPGYVELSYSGLQDTLCVFFKKSGKSFTEIASELKVKSISSISGALKLGAYKQTVSDKILTGVMKSINMGGLVVYTPDGEKRYYRKLNN